MQRTQRALGLLSAGSASLQAAHGGKRNRGRGKEQKMSLAAFPHVSGEGRETEPSAHGGIERAHLFT